MQEEKEHRGRALLETNKRRSLRKIPAFLPSLSSAVFGEPNQYK